MFNPAGFSRGYPALTAAISQVTFPVIEVHISNPVRRGPVSDTATVSQGMVTGFGVLGYFMRYARATGHGQRAVTSEAKSRAHRSTHWRRRLVISLLALVLASGLGVGRACALGDKPRAGETVTQYLTPIILQALFPGAERIGKKWRTSCRDRLQRRPPNRVKYFSTWDVTQSRGFADRPLVLLVGLALSGRITGVKLVRHSRGDRHSGPP